MCHEITSHYIPIVWLKLMTLIISVSFTWPTDASAVINT